jgi:hypothetical protein
MKVASSFATSLASLACLTSTAWAGAEDDMTAAVACSEANSTLTASFTLSLQKDKLAPLAARYDAASDSWTMLEGDLEEVDKEVRTSFEKLQEDTGQPGGLVPDEIFDGIVAPQFVEETATGKIYSFKPSTEGEDAMPEKMVESIDGRFTLDKATGCLAAFSMKATKPFKPATIAKIDRFDMNYQLAKPTPEQIPLMAGFSTDVAGSAMFKKFSETTTIRVFDVDILE